MGPPPQAAPWHATGFEPPVFLDSSGRRRHVVGWLGALAAGGTAAWLAALVVGATGFGALPPIELHHHVAIRPVARAVHVNAVVRRRHVRVLALERRDEKTERQ